MFLVSCLKLVILKKITNNTFSFHFYSYKVGNETNMAIMEVLLPTGWKMDNLESLMYNMEDPAKRIKKIETTKSDTNIVFYFDTIRNDQTCVRVPGK